MIPEDLMRKYKYGYVHSCEMLNEPFVKDLIKENQDLKKQLKDKPDTEIIMQDDSGKKYSIIQTQRIDMEETLNKSIAKLLEENQELKKQLENCYCNRTDCSSRIKDSKKYDSLVQKIENQQKEFINWLEDEIKEYNAYSKYIKKKVKELKLRRLGKTYLTVQMMKNETEMECYKNSLSKYEEIIGVEDETENEW